MRAVHFIKSKKFGANLALLFSLMMTCFCVNAQMPSNVIVNISAMPPYSPYLTDYLIYENQTVMTVTAIGVPGETYTIYFKGRIEGDNGVLLKTQDAFTPSQPFTIQANIPKQIKGVDLQDVFDWNHIDITGVSIRHIVRTNGVPEGNYTICLQAYDFQTHQMIGVESCSAPITIQHVNPPTLVSPICEGEVQETKPQTLLFSWTYSPGVTPSTRYLLKMVELLDNQNPNDAINSQTTPAYFEKSVSSLNYLYTAMDPVLKPGKKYAWRVKAYDLNNKVKFKNNGESEVCVFEYKAKNDGSSLNEEDITNSTQSHISGKANYYFVESNTVVPKNNVGGNAQYLPLKNTPIQLIEAYSMVEVFKVKKIVGKEPGGAYKYAWVDSIATISNSDILLGSVKPHASYPKTANCGKVIATTTTDVNGNYSFDIPSTYQSQIIDTFSVTAAQSTDGKAHKLAYATGLWFHYDSPYYYSSGQMLFVQGRVLMDNIFTVQQAKNYALDVKLKNYNQSKNYYTNQLVPMEGKTSDDIEVYVLKLKKASAKAPFNECGADGKPSTLVVNNKEYWVYAHKTGKQNSNVVFNDLIQNIYPNDGPNSDAYYIYAEPKDAKNVKYQPVKYTWNSCPFNDCFGLYQFDMEMSKYVKKELELSPYHVSLAISGKLKSVFAQDNGFPDMATSRPMANVPVKLVGQWVIKSNADQQIYPINGNSYDFAAGTTNADGEFSLNTGNTSFLMLGSDGMNAYQNSTGDYYAKDGSTKQVTGKKYYVLRVVVQSPYYYSPDLDLLVEPGYNYELGDLYAYVRESNVKLDGVNAVNLDIPHSQSGGILNPLKKAGERVYLCVNKKKLPSTFPLNETKMFSLTRKEIESNGVVYAVVDEATSLAGGTCIFKHVVLNEASNFNDRYFYFSESPDQSFDNYSSDIVSVMKVVKDVENEQKTYSNSPKYLKIYNRQKDLHQVLVDEKIYTWAQPPVITGAVYPESNYSTNPLQGVTVEVYDIPEAAINEAGFGQNGIMGVIFRGKLKNNYGVVAEASMYTAQNGKFQFNVNTTVAGKTNRKLVYFYKVGFTPYVFFVNGGATLKKGQKASLSKIFLELPATVIGKVVDEQSGQFIHAKVVVGDDFSWAETQENYPLIKQGNYYVPGPVATSQTLTMTAPRMAGVSFHVYPQDNDTYEPLHVMYDINLLGSQPNFTFKVKKRQHHVVIRVHSPGSDYIKNSIPVKATILNTNPVIASVQSYVFEKDNNNQSTKVFEAKLDFSSSAKSFLVKIESLVEGACYETKIVSIEDDAQFKHTFNFELKPCRKMPVHVDNDKGAPVANARVFIEGLPYTVPEVYTNANGDAELNGVPTYGSHVVVVIPPSTMANYYGSRKTINMATYSGAKINMKVNYLSGMDISSLVGFPIEVKTVSYGIGPNIGKTYISGSILVKGQNNVFGIPAVSTGVGSTAKNNNFDFEMIEVIASSQKAPSGLPYAVPKTDFWSATTIKAMTVFNKYDAYSYSAYGAFVKKISDVSGKIQSPVALEPASFKKGFGIPDLGNTMYISTMNYNGKTNGIDLAEFVDLFMSDLSTPSSLGSSFKVSTWNYKNVFYKLHNRYLVEAKTATSTFDKDGLHMGTVVHTSISQLANPDINLSVGQIHIGTDEVSGIYSETPISIPMDKWKFEVNKWKLDAGGLIVSGKILAGAITVPAKDVLIDKDKFDYGTYEVDGIKLGGNVSLGINQNNTSVSFGYDEGFGTSGAWSLSLLPLNGDLLTSLKNLPGLNPSDMINLKNISLYSKGSDDENVIMLSDNTPWVTLYGITKFRPSLAYATTGMINFRGKLDLQIPKMSELADAYTLRYEAKPSGLTLLGQEEPFSNLSINTKGIKTVFNTSNQQFTANKLVLHGKIYDQNPSVNYVFDVTLTKTNSGTTIAVDGSTQKYAYSGGASGLEKITGSMTTAANNTEWNNFNFEGDLYGLVGISDAKKHMKFKVEGDLIANDQNVGVNNIAIDGLGTGSITYDFGLKALVGHLHIDRDLSNCHLAGDVDLKFGGGDWYVFGSTQASNIQNSPVTNAKCGFFVGKGTISGNIQNVLAQYFYQQLLPDPFPKGSYTGALFCTEAALPVPIIPQLNVDLDPIVHCTLEHAIHLNTYTGISLDYPKISYDLGGQLYAYVHAGAGASLGLACVGADFSATAGAGAYGHVDLNIPGLSLNPVQMMSDIKNAIMNANITMQGEVFLNLQGTAYVGGGLCDSDCDGMFCESVSWSKGMDIILSVMYKRGEGIKLEGKKWNFH